MSGQEARSAASTESRPREDVLLYKVLRVRARLGLIQAGRGIAMPSEICLLDEVIEELSGVKRLAEDA